MIETENDCWETENNTRFHLNCMPFKTVELTPKSLNKTDEKNIKMKISIKEENIRLDYIEIFQYPVWSCKVEGL